MQRLKLQTLWLDGSLGLAVNQETSSGNLPLTPYYFWPVSEAWEQIQFELTSKRWITKEERIQLLNLAVDVMNTWQQNRTTSNEKIIIPNGQFKKMDVKIIGAS